MADELKDDAKLDENQLAHRIVQSATAEEGGPELVDAITQLLESDGQWADVIDACIDWTAEQRQKGAPDNFTRETIYYRLGKPRGSGPVLTPLMKAGLIERTFTNARGKPYYRLAQAPESVKAALQTAIG